MVTTRYGSQYIRSVYGILSIYNFDIHEATVYFLRKKSWKWCKGSCLIFNIIEWNVPLFVTIQYSGQYIRSVYGLLSIYNFDVHEATVYFLRRKSWKWCKGSRLIRGLTDNHLFFPRYRMCHPSLQPWQTLVIRETWS